ncbi:MAG: hypothetical protein EOO51_07190 [Flavobacterium sp.]|nr:MAG: hypothetical protein EOO51_07190 [Flavobacterium sp.]
MNKNDAETQTMMFRSLKEQNYCLETRTFSGSGSFGILFFVLRFKLWFARRAAGAIHELSHPADTERAGEKIKGLQQQDQPWRTAWVAIRKAGRRIAAKNKQP